MEPLNPENYLELSKFKKKDDDYYSIGKNYGLLPEVYSQNTDITETDSDSYNDISSTLEDENLKYAQYEENDKKNEILELSKQFQIIFKLTPDVAKDMATKQIKGTSEIKYHDLFGIEKLAATDDYYLASRTDLETTKEGIQYLVIGKNKLKLLTEKYGQAQLMKKGKYDREITSIINIDKKRIQNLESELQRLNDPEDTYNQIMRKKEFRKYG